MLYKFLTFRPTTRKGLSVEGLAGHGIVAVVPQ